MGGRLYGLLFVVLGAVITALAWWLGGTGLDLEIFQALYFFGPTLGCAGLVLVIAPGPSIQGHHDFADWFEHLPRGNRIAVFAAAGLGFALGFVLLLTQGSLLDALNPL